MCGNALKFMKTWLIPSTLLLLTVAIWNECFAQSGSGMIEYNYRLNLKGIPLDRSATLLFNDTASVFYHSRGEGITVVDRDGNVGGPDMRYTTTGENGGGAVMDFYKKDEIGHTYYFDRQRSKLFAREIVFLQAYTYEEAAVPAIDWEISDSTKMIGNYLCIAATAEFRGRNYRAWFTPEIALPLGPWKLQGLPGMILEAYDTGREVVFLVESIVTPLPTAKAALLVPPTDGINIDFETFKDIYTEQQRRINKKANSTRHRGTEEMGLAPLNLLEVFDGKD